MTAGAPRGCSVYRPPRAARAAAWVGAVVIGVMGIYTLARGVLLPDISAVVGSGRMTVAQALLVVVASAALTLLLVRSALVQVSVGSEVRVRGLFGGRNIPRAAVLGVDPDGVWAPHIVWMEHGGGANQRTRRTPVIALASDARALPSLRRAQERTLQEVIGRLGRYRQA